MKAAPQISLKRSFNTIKGVVALLVIFLVVQMCLLWRTCDNGTRATTGLEAEGLPSLRLLATLQENLAVYRLHSYELMFAQDKDRPAKIAEAEAVQNKNSMTIEELKNLYPAGQGHEFVTALQSNFDDYVGAMTQIRGSLDKDFAAAMKMLDEQVPAKVDTLNKAAADVTTYCNQVADQRTGLTVDSFARVRRSIIIFGAANIVFAMLAALLVTWNSSRVRGALNSLASTLGEVSHTLIGSAGTISKSSRILAEGSSAQAASLEESSASLEQMASVTRRNAENAQKCNELARTARSSAEKGAHDMHAMSAAMQDIKNSSDDIAKIIKTIDEIAFQTNILALNAAVEAARAGEAGMGFAVVADEVRNLAQRSAQAARETAAKIEGAIDNTARGVDISDKVSLALTGIVDQARQVDELATEVAHSCSEQTQGITQINSAVGQMDRVTQGNAASAEESAAAAQELETQARSMKDAVESLLQLVGRTAGGQVSAGKHGPGHNGHAPAVKTAAHSNGHGHGHAQDVNGPAGKAGLDEIPLEAGFRDF
ncbi:MAG TPA: methyl-accepting chemotaxis protein [Candidatus Sulfotelmatobacter sp.]|jgi:methyl-accepting chemotaxis protein|nr:methyl-accepting chemotaxis protein [Candidatus Sulfotelmatobacter sp.]